MDIVDKLSEELLKQPFTDEQQHGILNECQHIASIYAQMENALAVLCDMKTNISYIFYGGISEKLGLSERANIQTIHSIWEEDIFSRVHPKDLPKKHLDELRFYHFMKNVPIKKRPDYYLVSNLRMLDNLGKYINVLHRMFYLLSESNGSIRIAMCLYSLSVSSLSEQFIVNSVNGKIIELEKQDYNNILTVREKRILNLINEGKMSKDIAQILSISIYTVSRHRQNILEKLQVNNSIEACRVAKELSLL